MNKNTQPRVAPNSPQLIVDEVNKLYVDIKRVLASNQNLMDTPTDSISVKAFESREHLIERLTAAIDLLPGITSLLENALTSVKNVHAQELSAVDALINKTKKPASVATPDQNDATWTTITKRRPEPVGKSRSLRSYALATAEVAPIDTKYTIIKITEAISLPAISVTGFDLVKQDGDIYYVEGADHFAIRIAGQLFHGNVGVIYTEEKSPEKIKDCKFATSCMKNNKCDYYHDPLKFNGSHDHRNYIASSFLYAPPNSYYKNKPRSRRFGSLNYLDIDIVGMQDEEISRFNDQTTHDLLCSLILSRAYATR